MKFTVKAEGFINAISAAVDVATKGSLKDFVGGDQISIEASKDGLMVSAFGGRVSIRTTISDITFSSLDYKFEEKGEVSINAKDLMSVLTSFIPTENLIFEVKQTNDGDGAYSLELNISMESDQDQYQTLPCYANTTKLPAKSDNFVKTLEIKQYILVSGLERIIFAAGFEKEKPQFLNVAIKAKKNAVRFSAGTGGRHIVLDIEGNDTAKATPNDSTILIPKDYVSIINKTINTSSGSNVKIQESKKTDSSIFQVCVECGPQEIILVGLDPSLKWVDEQAVLGLDYTTKIIVKVSDLAYSTSGVAATFNDQMRKAKKIHKAAINVDIKKNTMSIKANEIMRSCRKVAIIDSESQENTCELKAASLYLKEISNFAKDDEYVQIQMIGHKKPIVVYGHASEKIVAGNTIAKRDAATGITEKLAVFFASAV